VAAILIHLDWLDFCQLWIALPDLRLTENLTDPQMRRIFYTNTHTIAKSPLQINDRWYSILTSTSAINTDLFKDPMLTPQKLIRYYAELHNEFSSLWPFALLNTICDRQKSHYELNPKFDLLAVCFCYKEIFDKKFWCIKIESYQEKIKRHRVLYEYMISCYDLFEDGEESGFTMSWSPNGLYLLLTGYKTRRFGNFAEISIFRYFPQLECVKMLHIDGIANDYLMVPDHLPSRFLWLTESSFVLPVSRNFYQIVRLTKRFIKLSENKKIGLALCEPTTDRAQGHFMALPEIGALAFLEDCHKGDLLFFDYVKMQKKTNDCHSFRN
jgi:hypothetical protein